MGANHCHPNHHPHYHPVMKDADYLAVAIVLAVALILLFMFIL